MSEKGRDDWDLMEYSILPQSPQLARMWIEKAEDQVHDVLYTWIDEQTQLFDLGPVDDFYREPIELTGRKTSGDGHVNMLTIVEWEAFFVLYLRKCMSFQSAR